MKTSNSAFLRVQQIHYTVMCCGPPHLVFPAQSKFSCDFCARYNSLKLLLLQEHPKGQVSRFSLGLPDKPRCGDKAQKNSYCIYTVRVKTKADKSMHNVLAHWYLQYKVLICVTTRARVNKASEPCRSLKEPCWKDSFPSWGYFLCLVSPESLRPCLFVVHGAFFKPLRGFTLLPRLLATSCQSSCHFRNQPR